MENGKGKDYQTKIYTQGWFLSSIIKTCFKLNLLTSEKLTYENQIHGSASRRHHYDGPMKLTLGEIMKPSTS